MPAKESFQMEHEKAKKRKGLRFGPFALFLLAIVVLASIATIIILTVFFVEQGQEISDLQNEVNGRSSKPNNAYNRPSCLRKPEVYSFFRKGHHLRSFH
jgi:hypothetical protein